MQFFMYISCKIKILQPVATPRKKHNIKYIQFFFFFISFFFINEIKPNGRSYEFFYQPSVEEKKKGTSVVFCIKKKIQTLKKISNKFCLQGNNISLDFSNLLTICRKFIFLIF